MSLVISVWMRYGQVSAFAQMASAQLFKKKKKKFGAFVKLVTLESSHARGHNLTLVSLKKIRDKLKQNCYDGWVK